jgi:hypothetical protein
MIASRSITAKEEAKKHIPDSIYNDKPEILGRILSFLIMFMDNIFLSHVPAAVAKATPDNNGIIKLFLTS